MAVATTAAAGHPALQKYKGPETRAPIKIVLDGRKWPDDMSEKVGNINMKEPDSSQPRRPPPTPPGWAGGKA